MPAILSYKFCQEQYLKVLTSCNQKLKKKSYDGAVNQFFFNQLEGTKNRNLHAALHFCLIKIKIFLLFYKNRINEIL